MYNDKRILALIPARGGSKGIKKKNIAVLNGYPLISYTIKESLSSKYVDDTVVTTDSDEIAKVSLEYGARLPFMRPKELADDNSKTIDAVIHAIDELKKMGEEYDVLLLLQPTQPLRTHEDIDMAIEAYFEHGMQAMVSVSPVDDHPLLIRTIDENGKLNTLLEENSTCRRQDMARYYRVNGCIYINAVDELSEDTSFNDNPIGFLMSKEHSVDIDEAKDLYLAEYYLRER